MARHRINENGHMMWFDSDEEYEQYQWKKFKRGFFIFAVVVAFIALISIFDKKEDKKVEVEKETVVTQSLLDEEFTSQQVKILETSDSEEIESAQNTMQYVVIDYSNIYLWEQPTTSAESLKWEDGSNCYPLEGEKYKSFGELAGFYLIDFHGKRVWVEKQYVHIESEKVKEQSTQHNSQSVIIEEGNVKMDKNTIYYDVDEEIVEDNVAPIEEDFSKQKVFDIVDEMPVFPGGDHELMRYIEDNLNYPQEALERGIQGRVFVKIIVEPNGSISNAKIIRGLGFGCDEEAISVIESMPNWEPGRKNGETVRVNIAVPVSFKLQ